MDTQAALREALNIERNALDRLIERVGQATEEAVQTLYACKGRIIVTGMGKAGLVGRKIAGTLSSTGSPAHFMHPTEGLHGDLGMVTASDVVIAISNSGETKEIVALLPYCKALEVKIVALTGNARSTLARQSDVVVDVGVEREADPLGIAPTASTTAAIAMGDALAAALMTLKGFTRDQYARVHPGGSLGASLLSRVQDLMITGDRVPIVPRGVNVREAIVTMSSKRLGAVFFVDEDERLAGILSDGDLRRLFERESDPLTKRACDVMTRTPKTIGPGMGAVEALRLMEDNAIMVLPVVDEAGKPVGAIHMHDLVKAGLALWKPVDA
ncbi:MAG TPA: KpsF/GutQ family sugar-phosphate isomerase [Candidatus Hydrogenedentes bacterium]|nr:KpsF/GutQ family sugar-phosphate isomerase [Candidatus Hydrogenedentota bacterium]HOS03849.1 KpsF/GutQ family sugar-phosphate isomerase [Candidatus Hydrogenedentota bacterium]